MADFLYQDMINEQISNSFTDTVVDYSRQNGNVYHDYKIQYEGNQAQKPLNTWVTRQEAQASRPSPVHSRQEVSNDWIVVTLLLSVAILGWIQFFFKKTFTQTLKASFMYKDAVILFKNQNSVSNRISFILNFLFYVNFSVYILLFMEKTTGSTNDMERLTRFGFIAAVLLIFILIKNFLYYSTGALFDIGKIVREYVYNGSIYNKFSGILILPIILAYAFLPDSIGTWIGYLGFVVFLVTYLMQLFRGVLIVKKNGYSLSYSLLYLITIELLPLILLVKWVTLNNV